MSASKCKVVRSDDPLLSQANRDDLAVHVMENPTVVYFQELANLSRHTLRPSTMTRGTMNSVQDTEEGYASQ